MTDNLILASILSTVGVGVFFAVVLAAAYKSLKVEEDPNIAAVEKILPGLNCGACGFAGCHAFALSLVKGAASAGGCLVGRKDVADRLSDVLGTTAEEIVKKGAVVHCNANHSERTRNARYVGIESCAAADLVKGVINCAYGCLGYGDCVKACPFGAITMVDGLPRIDSLKCIGGGECVKACPRNIISLEEDNDGVVLVACNSRDKGARVRKICSKGCTACGICQRLSGDVFKVEDNLARVDYKLAKSKEVDWRNIVEKCPTKVIKKTG